MKIEIDDLAIHVCLVQQPLGGQIGQRRVVLMHAGDEHSLGRRARRLGQHLRQRA